jgi:hypothetical protein
MPLIREESVNNVDSGRETISRVLTESGKEDIINLSGKKVEIIDRKSLLLIGLNG